MKRRPYTVQEKEELLKSEAIEKVANSSATYSKEFKVYAVGEYMTGKTPLQIFIEAGINVNTLYRYYIFILWQMRKSIFERSKRYCDRRDCSIQSCKTFNDAYCIEYNQ